MAMDEVEQEQEKQAEDSVLDITLENIPHETFESTHTSIMEICVSPSCERLGKILQASESVEMEQTFVERVSCCVETREAERIQNGFISSSSSSDHSDNEESDNRLIPPQSFTCTPLSTNKKYLQCRRSAERDFRIYDPEHDFFADCPELNKADGLLKWENIESKNCESSCTPVSKVSRSANKSGSVDNFVTPKRIITTPKRSRSRTKKKHCKRNLKVPEVVEANTGNITNTETLCMLMQGQRVVKDLWKRTENAKTAKRLRQRNDSPMGCRNISPGVAGISPLPKTPVRSRLQGEDAILSTQPTTPLLDSYEKESNSEEFDPTQPSSILVLQDVVAYVEVRSGGDNRSMGVKDQLRRLGATIVDTFSDEVTHVIFKEGLPSTYSRALKRGVPVVSVLWIEACKKAGLRVSERMYPIEEAFTRTIVNPQKKFRKMKSIQPDYDGKVERKKKRGKKDNVADEENISDEQAATHKTKSPKLMSIAEDVSSSGCHTFLKQPVLLSDASTDSDCSPDNLRVPKKNGNKKKGVPPVPQWARKSFSGNQVAETIVGVAKIRKKDVGETGAECPAPVETPTRTHESPLAMRLLQKVSSPSSEDQVPSTTCVDLYDNTKGETTSEKCITPIKNQDRTKKGKIIGEEKGDIRNWTRNSFSKKSESLVVAANDPKKDEGIVNKPPSVETPTCSPNSPLAIPLLQKVLSPASDAKGSSSSHTDVRGTTTDETTPDKFITPIKSGKQSQKQKIISDIRKWAIKSFSVNPFANNLVHDHKICEEGEENVPEAPPLTETPTCSNKSPLAISLSQKIFSPASNAQVYTTRVQISSKICTTPVRNKCKTKTQKKKGEIPNWARKSFNENPVTDMLINVSKICEENENTVGETSKHKETPNCPHNSPLAAHFIQKISSPLSGAQTPIIPHLDVNNITKVQVLSEKCVSPMKLQDRIEQGLSVGEGKEDDDEVADRDCSASEEVNLTKQIPEAICSFTENEREFCKITENQQTSVKVTNINSENRINFENSGKESSVCNENENNECSQFAPAIQESEEANLVEAGNDGEHIHADTRVVLSEISAHTNDVKNPQMSVEKSVAPEVSLINYSSRLESLNEVSNIVSREPSDGCPEAHLTDERMSMSEIETAVGETIKKSVELATKVDNNSNDFGLSSTSVLLQIDEDEFSSPESDIMIPEVEKCIATVSEDLQKLDEGQTTHLQTEVRSSSSLIAEPKPERKKPQKRKLIPTLDMENSEPIIVSGINQVDFFKPNRKRRCSSISGIYGSHLNRLTPKSSSEPDMRKIGKSVRDQPRVSDDMSDLWKLRKAARKVASPSLPSLVCTSLHQEDVDLVTSVVSSLGGFKIEKRVGPLTTHIIAGAPRRTLNMLFAIARGLWVLRTDWVLHSLEAGYWIDEEKFEMIEFSPVVMKNRIERQNFGPAFQPDLLSVVGPIFVTKDSSPPKEDVEELIRLCGGHIVAVARGATIVVGGQRRNNEVTCVSAQWVLDSITSGSVQSFDEYLLSQAPS